MRPESPGWREGPRIYNAPRWVSIEARPEGIEPPTCGFEGRRSIHLSYGRETLQRCFAGRSNLAARPSHHVKESGRPDSDRRPPAPKAGALPGCATPRNLGFGKARPFPKNADY